ncbi:carbon monoxide dehydrogenase subunit G [Bacillus sp. B15-48]|uniref:SRPBCC family protein n=1 Tax=Bacillus sp. B15-48 TaxID=1548601 RepID=UPI00193F9E9F|nr:carbon monoxide dehydrogenase subunit G [Bacillus sp. B15-48]MBM4764876.1 carbon monoxide dehydrogenase [Bacillus sp. B15-48]
MEVQGKVAVKASKEDVWLALNDPKVLQKATPGCKQIVEIEPDSYKADITLGIAAVRGNYEADIKIMDKEEPLSYRILMNANSSAGFIEGNAVVTLVTEGDGTEIHYNGTAKVGGLIAGVGQRILSGIAKMIVKDFFSKLAKEVKVEGGKPA